MSTNAYLLALVKAAVGSIRACIAMTTAALFLLMKRFETFAFWCLLLQSRFHGSQQSDGNDSVEIGAGLAFVQ
jgi:hypothetical protein